MSDLRNLGGSFAQLNRIELGPHWKSGKRGVRTCTTPEGWLYRVSSRGRASSGWFFESGNTMDSGRGVNWDGTDGEYAQTFPTMADAQMACEQHYYKRTGRFLDEVMSGGDVGKLVHEVGSMLRK